jgi:haloalkane dehalogenase
MSSTGGRLTKSRVRALDLQMAVAAAGTGDPIVFLHGNPTSSYLWRNIMPALARHGRCLAPDLIGMGDSDRLPDPDANCYGFAQHFRYLSAALENLGVEDNVTLVLHDWGSALGFRWALEHAERLRGIAYMEALVRPLTWAEWPEASRALFQALRSPKGEDLILERNVFIERILPGSILRKLTEEELEEYRRPFSEPGEVRRPMLSWPRQLPIDGEPAAVVNEVKRYSEWMNSNDVPKLFINAEPGAVLVGPQREFCRGWRNQLEVTVRGSHFIQEDSPVEITSALDSWLETLGRGTG